SLTPLYRLIRGSVDRALEPFKVNANATRPRPRAPSPSAPSDLATKTPRRKFRRLDTAWSEIPQLSRPTTWRSAGFHRTLPVNVTHRPVAGRTPQSAPR